MRSSEFLPVEFLFPEQISIAVLYQFDSVIHAMTRQIYQKLNYHLITLSKIKINIFPIFVLNHHFWTMEAAVSKYVCAQVVSVKTKRV